MPVKTKENEMYVNMAKLLLMAEDPAIRFADLQDPGNETKERLEETTARLMSAADAAKSENSELQDEADKTYQEYRRQCRSVVRKFSFEKEALYALGKNSEEMTKEEQDKVLLDPQNAGKIRKLMESVVECIQTADRTQGLSEYLKEGKLRHSSKIDYVAGQAMGLADEYRQLERYQEKQGTQAERKPEEERLKEQKPEEQKIQEGKEKPEDQNVQAEQERTTGSETRAEQTEKTEDVPKGLHAVPAPRIKDAEGLQAWKRLINWLAEKLGFSKVFSEKEDQKQKQDAETQTEYTNTDFRESMREKSESEEPERQARNPQREQEERTKHEPKKDSDYERQIRKLQIENLRKDSMIKYLQGELLKAQIIEQNLKNEKLLREIAASQNKQKNAAANEKTAEEQNSRKPEREKISFSQLAKEESDAEKKHPRLEPLKKEKVRAKDDSMIDYRQRKLPEKHKKELAPSK